MDRSNKDLMQCWRLLLKGLLALAVIASFLGGCAYVNSKFKLPDDHAGEALLERVIESHLGLEPGSFDLTPEYE